MVWNPCTVDADADTPLSGCDGVDVQNRVIVVAHHGYRHQWQDLRQLQNPVFYPGAVIERARGSFVPAAQEGAPQVATDAVIVAGGVE